jgi:PBSX family phage terminase large subunit
MAYEPLAGKAAASVQLATRRLNIWEGAVRSSKTIASIIAWLGFVRTGPPGDLVMIGKTERTLKRNILTVVQEMLGKRARLVEGSGELWILGRRIWLVGANDAQSEGKIRGMTLAGAYVDEASLMPEGMWRMLGTRLSLPGARLYATTNPDNPRHWLKGVLDRADLWVAPTGGLTRIDTPLGQTRLDLARFSFTLSDNPHLHPEYIDALKAEYSGLWRRRFILGEWCVAEGSIYDMWDPDRHVVDSTLAPTTARHIAVGVDYGTRHPFAAMLIALAADRLWVTDEWVWDSQITRVQYAPTQYSRALREWLGSRAPEAVYVDPAAADFSKQLWVDGMAGVTRADNDVAPGIRTLASLLSSGRLSVSSKCERLIAGIPGYSWDETAARGGVDKPIKSGDDEADAARYGIHSSRWVWEDTIRAAT